MVHYMTQSDYCSIIWRTLLHAEPLEDSEKLSCSIIGEGIERAEVEATASFQLHVPSDRSPTATFTVAAELTHLLDRSVTKCTITQRGETVYEIAYKPEIRGRHVLRARVGTQEVQGGPFTVLVHFPALKLRWSLRTIPGPSFPLFS